MIGLNDEQREACSYIEGPLLILAGAGSGKSLTMVGKIRYLIERKKVKEDVGSLYFSVLSDLN